MRPRRAPPPSLAAGFHIPLTCAPEPRDCADVDGAAGEDPALGLVWIGGLRLSAEGAPLVLPLQPPARGLSPGLTRGP